ncbi:AraC family transcriptional regulator [Devosia sp. A16]|uniref:AraC family transcriptional regulator n=1 Tax=Devosia sp. A16 TaxID=1736675 RepID=UPI0006D844EA|nr:AraC family transcriptional regulator [Devosia sp. A16]
MMASRVDLLSQVLTLIRLRGELIFSAELLAPWALQFEAGSAYFHVVSEGAFEVRASDGKRVIAEAGDLIVLPQGSGHSIGVDGAPPIPIGEVLAAQMRDDQLAIRLGGNGGRTQLITGAFRFEGDNMPTMLAVLPSLIHISKALRSEEEAWVEGIAHFLLAEARQPHPGSSLMISRLIDILVIRAMRTWVRTAPPENRGWLGALADIRISRALKAIHDAPFRHRSVAELAGIAGMSRSSFAERFATLIGAAPLHYQTRWRLLLANEMLKRPDTRVSDVGRRIGYESDAAFSRAFKAQFGHPPALVRRG